jgi:hypothetical protein
MHSIWFCCGFYHSVSVQLEYMQAASLLPELSVTLTQLRNNKSYRVLSLSLSHSQFFLSYNLIAWQLCPVILQILEVYFMSNHCFLQPCIYMIISVWHLDLADKGQRHEQCTEQLLSAEEGWRDK